MHQCNLIVIVKKEVLINFLLLTLVICKLKRLLLNLKLWDSYPLYRVLAVKDARPITNLLQLHVKVDVDLRVQIDDN